MKQENLFRNYKYIQNIYSKYIFKYILKNILENILENNNINY